MCPPPPAKTKPARGRSHRPGVALARTPPRRAFRTAWGVAPVNGPGPPPAPFAAGGLARCSGLARPAAPRARHVELHLARSLLDRACSSARGASLRRPNRACSVARLASVQSRDRELFHRAAHGIPEIDLELVFQVAAGFVFRLHTGASASAAEKLAEEIAEARSAARRAGAAAKIKSAKIKVDVRLPAVTAPSTRPARRKVVAVEAVLVVNLPLLGIGEDVVGFLQLLEFFFRGFVARIQIGVILPRQLAKRRTDILGARLPRHSQQFVIVLFCCRWHVCSCRGAASVPTLSGCFAPARHSR